MQCAAVQGGLAQVRIKLQGLVVVRQGPVNIGKPGISPSAIEKCNGVLGLKCDGSAKSAHGLEMLRTPVSTNALVEIGPEILGVSGDCLFKKRCGTLQIAGL